MDNYIIIEGKTYTAEPSNDQMACYKCAIYKLNVCSPMPKCIGGDYVYKEEE